MPTAPGVPARAPLTDRRRSAANPRKSRADRHAVTCGSPSWAWPPFARGGGVALMSTTSGWLRRRPGQLGEFRGFAPPSRDGFALSWLSVAVVQSVEWAKRKMDSGADKIAPHPHAIMQPPCNSAMGAENNFCTIAWQFPAGRMPAGGSDRWWGQRARRRGSVVWPWRLANHRLARLRVPGS